MIYKKRVVIFSGTTEGRLLSEHLAEAGVEVTACVATEYGEKLMRPQSCLSVHSGRMDAEQMADFLQQNMPHLVVDATHPYAQVVSETVKRVCRELHMEYVRLLRPAGTAIPVDKGIHIVEDAEAAAQLAERMQGNIFLTTGSKELAVFVETVSDFSRLYARVLSTEETFEICKQLGFEGKQLICMQGPFSEELNRAMFRQADAKILVTKDSGDAGGFSDKVQAALSLGMHCIVIQRPQEQGLSFDQVCERLGATRKATGSIITDTPDAVTGSLSVNMSGIENGSSTEGTLVLVGIGMGTTEQMTLEARHALEQAQVIFGAKRMLEAVSEFPAQQVCEYRREQIAGYLRAHPQITRAAVVFSGDVGFYSGADSFETRLDCGEKIWNVQRIAGISSVNYFAAKLGVAWQDVKLCSVHGRNVNLPVQIMQNRKVFSLLNGREQLAKLAGELRDNGMDHVRIAVGFELGYETEEIWQGSVSEFLNRPVRKGLCVALFENEQATVWMREDTGCETADDAKTCKTEPCSVHQTTGNLPDAAFLRGAVPLTKEEIRAVALSKLRLTADAVCYDIGAGTGGMTMDIARFVPDGKVIAFERNEEACGLIRANVDRLSAGQVTIVKGSAPEILAEFEPPTHAFIGGSGGRLREIVEVLLKKNPCMRIVIDAVTLETVGEANELLKTLPVKDVDIISVTVAKAKTAGTYHLMESMNPVYIFSFTGEGVM
ncbi:MAG: precorrin-6A reductase [bacterium]|nr:precorrin-6A reductase [bacterium]MDY4099246.1 precorrin-6A reductase [Lachnospiraceae bacterium]